MTSILSIVSILATTASICMLSAPIVTVRKLEQQRSIGIMTPTFFCAQLASSVVWSIYGVIQVAFGVILCNVVGNAIATYCLLVFLSVARQEEKSGHTLASTTYKKSCLTVLIALSFMMGASFVIVLLISIKPELAKFFNGLLGSCCSVFMLSSPLGMAGTIIKNKNAEGLAPLTMSFALVNTFLWVLYGLLTSDLFISVPNFLGLSSCIFQFFLLFLYGKKPAETTAVKAGIAPLPFVGE
ncbi:solute carrier family 50 (sugar transporter) [Trypanosoma theileri]|uniref:Solute carrier family 50 (Sugar transporter) n=1 Tax=Trypanosoma theileri TaxID=67003 RepID=A0A1X0NHK1_9TRYP|nr:solute carrier family 50 (sugar transporter) [Trypanosoma theileri]ORC83998.1 solute carrier family 50 (sugar transporter) [Trypanosoma theileri]